MRLAFLTHGGMHTVLSLLHVEGGQGAVTSTARLNTATQRVAARIVAAACLAIVPTTSALAAAAGDAAHVEARAQDQAAQYPAETTAGGRTG